MKFENGLFIFRRDFRVVDNNGLIFSNSKFNSILMDLMLLHLVSECSIYALIKTILHTH